MIQGYCKTNSDEYQKETWPTVFVAVPREGERIRAESGKILDVVKVTHYEHDKKPGIIVDLLAPYYLKRTKD